ncbi:unnamed protein product, partial [Polarella glacialis]
RKPSTLKALVVFIILYQHSAWAETADDCLNVEEPGYSGGDRQCFGTDPVGMVCGWDGAAEEAYCEVAPSGLRVCARRRGGGRCKPDNNKPHTDKVHDREGSGGEL